MSRRPVALAAGSVLCALLIGMSGCTRDKELVDTAKKNGKTAADFPETGTHMLDAMDGGIALNDNERKGRNTWILWTAGNDEFWDWMAQHSFGTVDLLKILDSRKRNSRFHYLGLMNEPGTRQAAKPDQYGLWLDERVTPEPADLDTNIYGRSSGIVGLRIYPNPNFDAAARSRWDPQRYYTDQNYYYDPKLVRPYRVGMACGFCHVAPDPLHPPADPENPEWANLSSNIGNQYFWVGRIFGYDMKPDNFVWQLLNSNPPGTLDTSFIATDNLNNPRTMNAIFEVPGRVSVATEETIAGNPLTVFGATQRMKVPHILKDGSDSIGLVGALSRVFINIGEFHQQWIQCINPILGGKPQKPFDAANAMKNSVYFQATAQRVNNLAAFFLRVKSEHLEDAPGGKQYLTRDARMLDRGKLVFAENCAECHSSKQPPSNLAPRSPEYVEWMKKAVMQPDFRDGNFFSNDQRYPVTLIGTNATSTLATNAMRGHVWDNFSSETYKTLPSVGEIDVLNPFDKTTFKFKMPEGGPGYHRVPSLVSLWATAPFFHNNALGQFVNDPSVPGRMKSFNDSIDKLLWPDKRDGVIWRTTQESWLIVNPVFLPDFLKPLVDSDGVLKIGPIPAGTPVNLLANINVNLADPVQIAKLVKVVAKIKVALLDIKLKNMNSEQAAERLKSLVPDLLSVSKCPDFVEDRGHLFGTRLADADKRALIEYLKTI